MPSRVAKVAVLLVGLRVEDVDIEDLGVVQVGWQQDYARKVRCNRFRGGTLGLKIFRGDEAGRQSRKLRCRKPVKPNSPFAMPFDGYYCRR